MIKSVMSVQFAEMFEQEQLFEECMLSIRHANKHS